MTLITDLLMDHDPIIRQLGVTSHNISDKQLKLALTDPEWDVRREVVTHPNATQEHINIGLTDPDELVRKAAQRNINKLSKRNQRS